MKPVFWSMAGLAILSLAVACNSNKPNPVGATVDTRPTQTATVNQTAAGSITQDTSVQGTLESARRISVNELKSELDKGQAVVVDVRPVASYQAGHAKGAISVPYEEFGRRMNEIPKGKLIVTYCS